MYILMLHIFPELHFVTNPKLSNFGDIIGYSTKANENI